MDWLYEASLIVIIVAIAVFMLVMAIHGYFMVRNRVPYVRLPEGARAFEVYYDMQAEWPPESLARRRAILGDG